jgi:hypothetical protein
MAMDHVERGAANAAPVGVGQLSLHSACVAAKASAP